MTPETRNMMKSLKSILWSWAIVAIPLVMAFLSELKPEEKWAALLIALIISLLKVALDYITHPTENGDSK